MSPQVKRILLFVFFIYLTFVGGTSYPDRNIIILILHHVLMHGLLAGGLLILFYRRQPFPRTALDLPMIALAVWILFISLASYDWRISLEYSWRLLLHMSLFYLFAAWMERGRQRWLMEGVFLSAALVVMVSGAELLSWYVGLGFGGLEHGWLEVAGFGNPIPPITYRLTLALNLSTTLGNYVVLTLPLVVAWMLTVRRREDRRTLALLAVGLILTLIMTQSRGGMLGVLAALVTAYILNWWRLGGLYRANSWRERLEFASIILFVLGGLLILVYISQSRTDGDLGRAILWERAQMILADHPIGGVGVGNYAYYLGQYGALNDTIATLSHAHNVLLQTAAEQGWLGLALWAWLTLAFMRTWWRRWQADSSAGSQIRLIGAAAALVGFGVHSLVDTFNYTANLLPFLVILAYIANGHYTHTKPIDFGLSPRPYYWIRPLALAGLLLFCLALLRWDAGQVRHLQSILAQSSDDYETALARNQAAQDLDPAYRLYTLREAYLLGLLAEKQADEYLEPAIKAYEEALMVDNQFDMGFANLAALYAQKGDFAAAIRALEQASAIRPDLNIYWAKLGEYLEASGEAEAAAQAYFMALDAYSPVIKSAYWQVSPLRQQVWEGRSQETDLLQFVYDVERGHLDASQADLFKGSDDPFALITLGLYFAQSEDHEEAITWFTRAYEQDKSGWIQAQVAKAHLALGNTDKAEESARLALFLTQSLTTRSRLYNIKWLSGQEAYAVLAELLPLDEKTRNAYLIRAVNPSTFLKTYDLVVLGNPAYWDYLPQFAPPGLGESAFEPWFRLAEYFASDDDPETDPLLVYKRILFYEPSSPTARALCGAECD